MELQMELLSAEFLSALAAIVVIDLVLAGDNAIVIALAARNLPPSLRQRAIVWGTFGAIAVRTLMTLVVVWLLKIPGLLFTGGLLLGWIAFRLIVDNGENGAHQLDPAASFWGAMKTIVVADALMGLDNVLAVAGAAQGSFLLVVLGLLISIPIVVWGSQLVLKLVQRYPVIVYIGAAVLAWTAVGMMASEPLLKALIAPHAGMGWAAYLAVIGGVLSSGFLVNYSKIRARVAERSVHVARVPVTAGTGAHTVRGGSHMMKVLIPIDASPNSLKAVEHAVSRFLSGHSMEIHLLHVRKPLSRHIASFVGRRTRSAYHREQAEKALAAARATLEKAGVPYAAHLEVGDDRVRIIHNAARRLGASQILVGTARPNTIARILRDCATNRLLEIAQVPVEVVPDESVPWLERIGVPAGIGGALALLYAAVD
jgi:YjbE family integral membrane protein